MMDVIEEQLSFKKEIDSVYKGLFINILRYTFITLIIIILATLITTVGYGFVDDYFRSDEIAKGITIDGHDVGGKSIDEAYEILKHDLESKYHNELIFESDENSWAVNPEKFSFSLNYEKMIRDAYYVGYDSNIFYRIYTRFKNKKTEKNIDLAFNYNKNEIKDYLKVLAYELNTEPQDAYIEIDENSVNIHPDRAGLTLDVNASVDKVIDQFVSDERKVELNIKKTEAQLTVEQINKIIIIKRGQRKLFLYQKEKLLKSYPVAVGQPAYPTPYGDWAVIGKRRNPAWYNPQSGWSKNMPKIIPPGPGNPLGTRAIELNAPAIRIHGTTSPGSIGRAASHGCIRMFIRDSEELFEMIPIGTPVYIR